MNEKVLLVNKWISVNEKNGYVYYRHPWCQSTGVAILPYQVKRDGSYVYLGRFERFMAHGGRVNLYSVTGGYDDPNITYEQCAAQEVEEETGYLVQPHHLQPLGTIRPSKASDTLIYLYAVEITEITPRIGHEEDGVFYERNAFVDWVSKEEAIMSEDPFLPTMIIRLEHC